MRRLLTYIASALALWLAFAWATGLAKYRKLAHGGTETTGKVAATTCENHASFKYEYVVQGKRIVASGKSSEGGLVCADLTVGQSIPVVYLPRAPEESIAGNALAALSEARGFVAAVSLTLPAIGLWLRRRARAKTRVA
jgi:hypothetical protein